ncbi:MAG: hypothetical protein ACFFDN_00315 [Candidatus Hodarchaeota archaeon]
MAENKRNEAKKNFLTLKKVSEIAYLDLNSIPVEYHDSIVSVTKKRKVKKFYQHLRHILNERFVREQLGLKNQTIDFRDLWYSIVDYRMKGNIDISLNDPYIATEKAVKEYCLKLMDFYNVEHWSMVMDNLNLESKGKAIIYSIADIIDDSEVEGTVLTVKSIQRFEDIPFFIILCEKETVLKQTLLALKSLGYTSGFYGINTGGVGTSAVARLLLYYSQTISHKFYMFSLTDFDLAGLKIYFDFRKYFETERAGLNSEMIDYLNLDFELLTSKYTSERALNKQKKGCLNMLEALELSEEENTYFLNEIEKCSKNKIELNSLTAYRSETNKSINPAIDYANYIIHLLETKERIYDLNRFRQIDKEQTNITPSIKPNVPKFIIRAKERINDLIFKDIDSADFWLEKANAIYNTFDIFNRYNESKKDEILEKIRQNLLSENEEYNGSLKDIYKHLHSQEKYLESKRDQKNRLIFKNVRLQRAIIKKEIEESEIYIENKKQIKKILKKIEKKFKI